MLLFPNCKINLGLKITGKRVDGYHNIETVFFPVPLSDAVEIIDNKDTIADFEYSHSGLPIGGEQKDNLCMKAWQLLRNDFPTLPSIKLHLHKAIPMGAGLGGGSADGAFTLQLLNQKYALGISQSQLLEYALQLGSDCPFFIINTPCLASGRGEQLQPIPLSLTGYQLVVVNPGIHVNTGWAFSQITAFENATNGSTEVKQSLSTVIAGPIEGWRNGLENDFEIPVFKQYPAIQSIKESLYQNGAVYASMSGSGSSVFGIFANNQLPSFGFSENYLIHTSIL